MARAAHRRDRPPPPVPHDLTFGRHMMVTQSSRDDDAVLGQPILEALLPEVVRAKQQFEAMADGVEGAMADEGRAQQRAQDQVVAERVEALGILERGNLRGRRLDHVMLDAGELAQAAPRHPGRQPQTPPPGGRSSFRQHTLKFWPQRLEGADAEEGGLDRVDMAHA